MNPAALAQKNRTEEVRLLTNENLRLRERVKVLEGKLTEAHNITQQVELNMAPRESEQLAGGVTH